MGVSSTSGVPLAASIPLEPREQPGAAWSVWQVGGAGGQAAGVDSAGVVTTSLDDTHELVTTFGPASGVVTSADFGCVVGSVRAGGPRVDVRLRARRTTAFTVAHRNVRIDDEVSVDFVDDVVRVSTALLTAVRSGGAVRVLRTEPVDTPAGGVVYDIATGTVEATVDSGEVVNVRVGAGGVALSTPDEVAVRVGRDGSVDVRPVGGTALALDPATGRLALTTAQGSARIDPGGEVVLDCARIGWRVSAGSRSLVLEQSAAPGARVCWEAGTGELRISACPHEEWTADGDRRRSARPCRCCGASLDVTWDGPSFAVELAGMVLRWSGGVFEAASARDGFRVRADGRVRISWCDTDFVVSGGRVWVADHVEDWYVTPDGRVVTAFSVVSAGHTIDGTVEVVVRGAEDRWSASLWACGVSLDDGKGMRVALDESGDVVCTPVERLDTAVAAHRCGDVAVSTPTATASLGSAGEVRLRDSDLADLTVHPRSPGRPVRSTITCGDRFSVAVTDSAVDDFSWTVMHLDSLLGHAVRAPRGTVALG